jgi:NAD(P)-dependent dehydrogenase (short-subunit alcohol dehydrogenase family)
MMTPLQGKVVVITGAAGGIGSAVARRFAEAGARLALLDSNGPGLAALAFALSEQGATVQTAVADLGSEVGVKAGLGVLLEHFSYRLDVLVANVGRLISARFMELTLEQWQAAFDLNFFTHLWACRFVVPLMQAQGSGHLVFTLSDQAIQPDSGLAPYSVAKTALLGLVKVLARELAPDILVNGVAPGMTRTPLVEGLMQQYAREFGTTPLDAERRELARRGVPLCRLGEPEEVAEALHFLVTNPFSCGTILNLSGGNVRALTS